MNRSIPKMGRSKCAFTLIEIMLALLVVMIGIVAITGLLGTSLDSSAKSHDDIDVVSFADMVFNYCHSLDDFNAIPTSGNFTIQDYNEETTTTDIQIGPITQFDCPVTGFENRAKRTYTLSYQLDVAMAGNVKELTLDIWPGYNASGPPRRFYTEIYNWAKN